MSLQLETRTVVVGGVTYTLKANMKALEALQEECGSMSAVYEKTPGEIADCFFRAMLNCARKKMGEEPIDPEIIHEDYSYAMLHELDIVGMLNRAMFPPTAEATAAAQPEHDPQPEAPAPGN